jgi:glycosyltransferase involved in cell wall biosynthesis
MNLHARAAVIGDDAFVMERPQALGKFLFACGEKLWVRGVTYGTFQPDSFGIQFPAPDVAAADFGAMARAGLNAVRVYTPPPLWMLTLAASHGLRLMIGLPWEQHVSFLDDPADRARIVDEMRASIRQYAGHPAVLCYAVGNEIPASVVRWYGRRRIESFLRQLCEMVRVEDPGALVTYVNFPTTEYLDLPFIDILSFNVYLESKDELGSYLARLQNIARERPLLMAEIGLDSRRNGEIEQGESLRQQISSSFTVGGVGAFVFAWTDEWYRGGHNIEDWDFGLTTRDRQPKPSLAAVERAYQDAPFARAIRWPRISVIVCSHNGAVTIDETLSAFESLAYQNFETIVVDDGSTDDTSTIAETHRVRLIRTENRGLSSARNTGLQAATGEIVAYIDDDAYPDPDWLRYLASAFLRTEHAGIGGLNIAPAEDGTIADCVANAPGGPVHVLLSDEVAEHIPGCNMAFRREQLLAIGGFDPRFRVAGDDVDICWRLQEQGCTIGFAAAAVVWHHRRNSLKSYFNQQRGYARAEALLAEKWPSKYNRAGHLKWQGRLYGRGIVESLFARSRIYHGVWGSAPFQSVYEPCSGKLASLTLMPEWYALLTLLGFVSTLGMSWTPLLWATPLLIIGIFLTAMQAARTGTRAIFSLASSSRLRRAGLHVLVALLHLVQPGIRLVGRIQHGMGPWSFGGFGEAFPLPTTNSFWAERWDAIESRLSKLGAILKENGTPAVAGDEFDRWDLSVHAGLFGAVRVMAMVEEHGNGHQLCRFRSWPKPPIIVLALLFALSTLATAAAVNHGWIAGASLGLLSAVVGLLIYAECSLAMSYWRRAFEQYVGGDATKHMMSPTAPNNRYIPACIQFRFRNFAVGRSSVQRGANALDRGILGHVGRTAHRSDDAVVGYQHTKDSMLPHRHL